MDELFHSHESRSYLKKAKNFLIDIMGGKCARCGFLDRRALQIDHVNGGGRLDRKELDSQIPGGLSQSRYYKIVEKSFLEKENKYQILCANCNWIKRVENREFGGRKHYSQKTYLKSSGRHIYGRELKDGIVQRMNLD